MGLASSCGGKLTHVSPEDKGGYDRFSLIRHASEKRP